MHFQALTALLFLFLLTGCSSLPDTYAPPIQRKPLDGTDPEPIGQYIAMNHPDANAYLVSDVSRTVESGTWRWAFRRPTLRFFLHKTQGLRFVTDFSIAAITLKETGPVTLTWSINGNVLDRRRFDHDGDEHFEKAVPVQFLKRDSDNLVTIEPDKVWVSKADGVALGFVLTRAGFVE